MGCSRSWVGAAACVALAAGAHVLVAPYTKIEERFVLNAVHDALVAPRLAEWDYRQFPDPVPHSFAGIYALAVASLPACLLASSSAQAEVAVRLTLCMVNVGALVYFCCGLDTPFALLLTAVQFHFLFWAGRTTHNSIALAPTLVALRLIYQRRHGRRTALGLAILTFTAALLRSELVGLLAPSTLWVFITGRLSFLRIFLTGLFAGLAALAYGTLIDQPAWSGIHEPTLPFRLFLPEWEALLFNILHGKSKEWGVMPWHWYATHALPKVLTVALPFVPLGGALLLKDIFQPTSASVRHPPVRALLLSPTAGLLGCAIFHVSLLSLVAHKEWRFIVYTVPVFNLLAARALEAIWPKRPLILPQKDKPALSALERSLLWARRGVVLCTVGLLSAVTLISVGASRQNYPGGQALALLHESLNASPDVPDPMHPLLFDTAPGEQIGIARRPNIHIDVAATTTGATLFQNLHAVRTSASGCWSAFGACWLPRAWAASSEAWDYSHAEDLPTGETVALHPDLSLALARWADFTAVVTGALDCQPAKHNLTLRIGWAAHGPHAERVEHDVRVAFVPLAEPVRAFRGLRRWALRTYLDRARAWLRQPRAATWDHLLPVALETADALRVCRRRYLPAGE